jgi:hypothetical protein
VRIEDDVTSMDERADRQAIYDVVLRYCRGIDRLDMDLVRSCYHPDGIDHHTGFEGERDDYITWVEAQLRKLVSTMHMVGNHAVSISGDVATSETYGTAFHLGDAAKGTESFTTGYRWVDRFERRDGEWRVTERFALREWTRAEPDQRPGDPKESPTGSRDKNDPSYQLAG